MAAVAVLPGAHAIESELTHAIIVPQKGTTTPAAIVRATQDPFWTQNLTQFLRGRLTQTEFDPAALLSGLTMLGVDETRLSSPVLVPAPSTSSATKPGDVPPPATSSRPVLRNSVCMASHAVNDEKKALLVTVPLTAKNARRTAVLFAWLTNAKPKRPVFVCATAADTRGASMQSVEELLTKARERRLETGFNGFAGFAEHIDWAGDPAQVYVNFAGLQSITMNVTDNYIQWQETQPAKTNAFGALTAVKTELLKLPLAFKTDRFTPYTATQFSAVRCKKDWSALLKSSCTGTVAYVSRSKVALTEAGEATYGAAQRVIRELNKQSRKGSRRDLTISFPENFSFAPVAQKDDFPLITSWKTIFAGFPDARVSSRFVESSAAVTAGVGVPAIALGLSEDAEETSVADLESREAAVLQLIEERTDGAPATPMSPGRH